MKNQPFKRARNAITVRQLDHLDYAAKLRHWMRIDAWNPNGSRLHFKNAQTSRSTVRMNGGHIMSMPLLVAKPCFGIATAYLRYRDEKRFVKGIGHRPTGRCARCKSRMACHVVVDRRLRAAPSLFNAWTEWLQYDGPRAFGQPGFDTSHTKRLWGALYRELAKHPFTSVNDTAVVAHYENVDAIEREKDRKRQAAARAKARHDGIVDEFDLAALERAALARRMSLALAVIHPDTPKELYRVPQESLEDLVDVWLGREVLHLRKMNANAPSIARWICQTGRGNRSKNHPALSSRVAKDLKRLNKLERVTWDGLPLVARLDPVRELHHSVADLE